MTRSAMVDGGEQGYEFQYKFRMKCDKVQVNGQKILTKRKDSNDTNNISYRSAAKSYRHQ